MSDLGDTPRYPTIERLADLSQTTQQYQGPVLVEEAVRCWRELRQAAAALERLQNQIHEMEITVPHSTIIGLRAQLEEAQREVERLKKEGYWQRAALNQCIDKDCPNHQGNQP